jgi:hypothetical protein
VVSIVVLVHPINTAAHPDIPPGFRWAVMVGQGSFSDMDLVANAGWCPTRPEARLEGDQNAATATRALRLAGVVSEYGGRIVELDHDPIPSGEGRINVA